MKRRCQICGATDRVPLHRQEFIIPEQDDPYRYTVCACAGCGFLFSDDIPSQEQYDAYYKTNAKYAYSIHRDGLPDGLKKIHQETFSCISDFLRGRGADFRSDAYAVLDIGCSTGYLLHLFKESGYAHIRGIEPARECSAIARRLYGVEVLSCLLSELKQEDRYDLIILSAIVEHIAETDAIMGQLGALLKDRGVVCIVVPDVEGFAMPPREPFHEFSLEHINFFTAATLGNLLQRYGLSTAQVASGRAELYSSALLRSFSVKGLGSDIAPARDVKGVSVMKRYIEACVQKLELVREQIRSLVRSREGLAVWGCGSLTSRLLACTELRRTHLRAFIDSDKNLHGKKLAGIEIQSPEWLVQNADCSVFVSSYVYGAEIRETLNQRFKIRGRIVLPD
ncbi:MAG: class I SAM-dependent methyltransferase [Candidatus Aureabacteria bacterium]|nr:class I SAM-dependent methyltransferase [Candidatus Auribacterota bacterium]